MGEMEGRVTLLERMPSPVSGALPLIEGRFIGFEIDISNSNNLNNLNFGL